MTLHRASRPLALVCIHAALFLAVAGSAFAAAAPSRAVGNVAALLNDVRIRLIGTTQPRPAVLRQRLSLGDQVQTAAASHMQAVLLDRSAFTVGPNSRLTIDRFVYNPAGSSFTASIAKGAMRFMSGGRNRASARSIRTPVATIGIRGTVVDTVVGEDAIAIARAESTVGDRAGGDPAGASLIVLRGPGPGAQGNVAPGAVSVEAGGRTVDLDRPLQAVYVPGTGAAPIGPFTISLDGQARVNDLILPAIQASPREPSRNPYLQRRDNDRRFVPGLPGNLPHDQPRPDVIRPGDVPLIVPEHQP
jgi:hypothetical protein